MYKNSNLSTLYIPVLIKHPESFGLSGCKWYTYYEIILIYNYSSSFVP